MSARAIGLGILSMMAVLSVPAVASAHIKLTLPTPRSADDGLKPPTYPFPCGGIAAGKIQGTYKPGDMVDVKWLETIGHQGCFQIAFSSDGTNFQLLKQINDPAGAVGQGLPYADKVQLPAGVTCAKCVLQLRQIMLDNATNKTCTANMTPPTAGGAQGNTYVSCADIRVGDFPDAGPETDGGDEDAGSSGSSGSSGASSGNPDEDDAGASSSGKTGSSSSGSAAPKPTKSGDDGGCNVGSTEESPVGLFTIAIAGFLGLAAVRRRKSK